MLIQAFGSSQAPGFVAACFHEDVVQSNRASCEGNKYQAGDSMTSGQVTRHDSDSFGCEFLHVDEDLLADCLKKGYLPLLQLKEETNSDEMSIEVVASTDSTSYIALAHVCADDLGNPIATASPRRQLPRLKALIDDLDVEYLGISIALGHPEDTPKMLLWYDISCCPGVSREAQSMASRQMYRSYDEASIILGLDRSLVSHCVGGVSVDEACLRIAASRWIYADRGVRTWQQEVVR